MTTKLVPLDFEHLATLDDGRIDRLLRMHVARAAQDCMDRPGDKSKRVVSLSIAVEPVVSDDGQCESTRVEIECKSKVPVFRSRPYEMHCTKAGLRFNQDFPEELDQQPLFPREHSGE